MSIACRTPIQQNLYLFMFTSVFLLQCILRRRENQLQTIFVTNILDPRPHVSLSHWLIINVYIYIYRKICICLCQVLVLVCVDFAVQSYKSHKDGLSFGDNVVPIISDKFYRSNTILSNSRQISRADNKLSTQTSEARWDARAASPQKSASGWGDPIHILFWSLRQPALAAASS